MKRRLKILLIDDFPFARDILRRALANFKFEILEAANGQVGLQMLEESANQNKPFSLVICDYTMPGMTGLEVLKAVRANPKIEKLPFVLTTAQGDEPVVITALSLGAIDFLKKPMPADEMEKRLQAILKKVEEGA